MGEFGAEVEVSCSVSMLLTSVLVAGKVTERMEIVMVREERRKGKRKMRWFVGFFEKTNFYFVFFVFVYFVLK